jgi:hypothetical protein
VGNGQSGNRDEEVYRLCILCESIQRQPLTWNPWVRSVEIDEAQLSFVRVFEPKSRAKRRELRDRVRSTPKRSHRYRDVGQYLGSWGHVKMADGA